MLKIKTLNGVAVKTVNRPIVNCTLGYWDGVAGVEFENLTVALASIEGVNHQIVLNTDFTKKQVAEALERVNYLNELFKLTEEEYLIVELYDNEGFTFRANVSRHCTLDIKEAMNLCWVRLLNLKEELEG